jgi:serine phosphatase RsbU (regulator of sigma subunit)
MKGQPYALARRSPDHESLVHLLLHTLGGRVLIGGAIIRVIAWAIQRVVGPSALIEAVGSIGTLALLGAIGYYTWRLVSIARRRFLWRVRRKLILSFIFVGLVPAFLIIAFFTLCGLFLFGSISSYVVQMRLERLADQMRSAAAITATELARARSQAEIGREVEQTVRTIAMAHPGASIAVLPVQRACASEVPDSGVVLLTQPLRGGPWTHVPPPDALPEWIGCSGFSGVMAYWTGSSSALSALAATRFRGAAAAEGEVRLFIRSVAVPDSPRPRFAVVVDVPLEDAFRRRLREDTGIGLRHVNVREGQTGAGPMLGRRQPRRSDTVTDGSGFQPPAFLNYTDWSTGRIGEATLLVEASVTDLYSRLAPTRGAESGPTLGERLLLVIVIIGVLFLVIQFVALLMGLALARSITGSVHELFVGTERVQLGDFSHKIRIRARDQLGELADSFNSMTARLGELLAEMAEKKRLEEELRIAREIQMSLLPQNPPTSMPGLMLTALCHPAREVGGDYYDFLELGPNRLGLLIADVSGKGTSAALYMAELKGLMLSLSEIHRSPRELLIAANRIISGNLDSRSFITMTYAVIDLDAMTMTWARAGHTPLIHLPAGKGARQARVLVTGGLVLGLKLDNGERFVSLLEEVTTPLVPGDLFMFFTDGLSEQMNAAEELFGEGRLAGLIEQHCDLPFDELRERIVREVRAFAAGAAQHDDMTFILLRVEDVPSVPAGEALVEEVAAV